MIAICKESKTVQGLTDLGASYHYNAMASYFPDNKSKRSR